MKNSIKRHIIIFLSMVFFLLCKNEHLHAQCENELTQADEIICLKTKVNTLNTRLDNFRNERQRALTYYRDTLMRVNDHVNELEERLENETFSPVDTGMITGGLRREIRQLRQLVASKEASISTLQRSLETSQNNYTFCLEVNEGLLATITQRETEINRLAERLASQSNTSLNDEYLALNRVLRRRVDSLELVINTISSSPSVNHYPPNDSLGVALLELNNSRAEIRSMQFELNVAYDKNNQLNRKIDGLNQKIGQLNSRLTQARNRITELNTQLKAAKAQIVVLEATIEGLIAEIQERDRKIDTLTIERNQARDSIQIHIAERDQARDSIDLHITERDAARDTIYQLTQDMGAIISYVNLEEKRKRRYEYNSFIGLKLGLNALPKQTREIQQGFGASLLSSLQFTLLGKRLGLWFGNITNIDEGVPPAELYSQLELDQAYRRLVEGGFNPAGLGISTSHANIRSFQAGLYFRIYPQLYLMGGASYLNGEIWEVYQTNLAHELAPNDPDGNYAISTLLEGAKEINPVIGVAWHQPLSSHKTRGGSLLVESGFNFGYSNFFTNVGVTFQLTNIEPKPLNKADILDKARTSAAVSRRSIDSTVSSINDNLREKLMMDEEDRINGELKKLYSENAKRIEVAKGNKKKRILIRRAKQKLKKKTQVEREKSTKNLTRQIEKLLNDVEGLDDAQKRYKIRFWETQIKTKMRKKAEDVQKYLIQQLDELRP